MQKLALRILSRFSRKSFIRSAWKNLNSLSEHDELAEALETLISMSHEENEFIELITVIVDVLSEAPMASAFLSLPSKETSHKITSRLLQKLKPEQNQREEHVLMHQQFGVFLLRSWQISLSLFSDNVCNTLLDYLQYDNDSSVQLFALIALEKFGMTGQNKEKIFTSGKDIHKILQTISKELQSDNGLSADKNRRMQLKFCVEWALKNTFAESSVNSNINVMLNPLDATAHWKLSPNGLELRNDYSTFESIRATMSVSSGKWFYEVILLTNGIMQIGYATKRCMFGPEEGTGVGDDQYGFAFDGCRNFLWVRDVIGVYMDVSLGCVRFYLNGKDLGVKYPFNFVQFRKLAENGLYPALSFTYPPPPSFFYQTFNSQGQLSSELRDSIQRRSWRTSRYRSVISNSDWKQQLEATEEDYDAQCSICFAMPPKPTNSNSSLPNTITKLSISSTSASSSLSSPSTAIVLPPTPPYSRPASSITSLEPDISRGLEQ
ncbi:1144_t:CDS:10 [Entrophospora sp. SA101]|nr:15572_t:CDS:10 [Entrophospora sp. SA101]CAJ0766048.1 1144_t:CDS:10 [Entrophospora sp. SA101]